MQAATIHKRLTRLLHRGATTQEEQQAAEMHRKALTGMNIPANIESFKASSSYSWEVILFSLTMAGGLLISPWLSKLGAAIVLLGFWSYVRHFMGRPAIFTPFTPKSTSQNVVGQIKPLEYRRAYFDTLAFAQHGYPCTTLIALDKDGIIPNWHWYTDTMKNINDNTITATIAFASALVQKINRK